jgi:hypothetical protein
MLGCTDIHPQDRDQLLLDFDNHMLTIMKDKDVLLMAEEDESASEEYNEDGEEEYEEGEEEWKEDDGEDEDLDIEEELGLGREQR